MKKNELDKVTARGSFTWILFVVFCFIMTSLGAAWLDDMPMQITQPDGAVIDLFASGDEFHNWLHDMDGYTIIQDSATGYWCWAVAENGDLVSTGHPIHIVSRESLSLEPGENISKEKYLELRAEHDALFSTNSFWAPNTGIVHNIVIFIRFADDSEFESSAFEAMTEMLNGQGEDVNSLYQYFYDVSYQKLEVFSSSFPISNNNTKASYQFSEPRGYFEPYDPINNTIGYKSEYDEDKYRYYQLISEPILAIRNQIPTDLNIDSNNDGYVDNICFIVKGETGAMWLLWPHMSFIGHSDLPDIYIRDKRVLIINMNFEDNMLKPDGGIKILCHEFAHSMGLPDLYRIFGTDIRSVYTWDLMASPKNPPPSISSYIKMKYTNWVTEIPWITASGTYTLNAVTADSTNHAYQIASPNSTFEHFVVEYRVKRPYGIDSAIAGSGLLIYRVNTTRIGNLYPPDELYVYRPNGTTSIAGDIDDAFYSAEVGRTAINHTTNPPPFLLNGALGGLNISDIGYPLDSISFYYSTVDFIKNIGPDDCLQAAIDSCLSGGTVILEHGIYDSADTYLISDQDITIMGSKDKNNPSIIKGRFVISNVSNNTAIKNITFIPKNNQNPETHGIKLINATPILSDLVFDSGGYRLHTDIEIESLLENNLLKVKRSVITGYRGIYFRGGMQNPFSKIIIDDCLFSYDENSFPGTAVDFVGTDIEITNSKFTIFDDDYDNIQQVMIGMVAFISSPKKEIKLVNNEFIIHRNVQSVHSVPRQDHNLIKVFGDNSYILNIVKNKFLTMNLSREFYPVTVIYLDDASLSSNVDARVINNTEIIIGVNNVICEQHYPHNFLYHNGYLELKNNLLTGAIHSTSPYARNNISYSWFIHQGDNFPPGSGTEMIYYGDPKIDFTTLQPIWTESVKSGLIGAGDPDTNNNEIPWWHDVEDQDTYGNRLSIGAVPPMQHSWMLHALPNPPDPALISAPQNFTWISFPFLDKLYSGMIAGRPAAELYYNLHIFNDNDLLSEEEERVLEQIQWLYGHDAGSVYVDPITGLLNGDHAHILDSRHGYKVRMINGKSKDIVVSGFLSELYGNNKDDLSVTIMPNLHGDYTEIWLGYYKIKSEEPLIALEEIESDLIEIKTQRWSMNRDINGIWISDRVNPRFNFGEAVSLKYVGGRSIDFTWNVEANANYPEANTYDHPIPMYFMYEEQIDYVPIYIYLPEDLAHAGIGEIGIFIDNICYGAEPIMSDVVQLNGYFIGLNFEEAEIEFLYHEYNSRSPLMKLENYLVLDQKEQEFQTRILDLGGKDLFYVVSFKNENDDKGYFPSKTTLDGNFPNPFNPTTTIRYSLAETEYVNLKIYNIRGQLVKFLVNETQEPGRYSVVWEGDNDRNNRVASGIYFYRFETGAGVEIKRMLLLK